MKKRRFMAVYITFLITTLILTLSACSPSRIDPFKFASVLRIDESNYQMIFSSGAPVDVIEANYSINAIDDSLSVILSKNTNFSRNSKKIKLNDVFNIVSNEQTRGFLISESKLPRSTGFSECYRLSTDEDYPVFFGLNLVYFFPREVDESISDIYVFSNLIYNNESFFSIDSRTWKFSNTINSQNPIIGNERIANHEKVEKLKHALELNSYTCITK